MLDINPNEKGGDPTWLIILELWRDYATITKKVCASPEVKSIPERSFVTPENLMEVVRSALIEQYTSYKNSIEALQNPYNDSVRR